MKWLLPFLLLLRSCQWAPAAVRIDCDPVATATDYRFYFGTNSRAYSAGYTVATNRFIIDTLPAGQWFAAVTAINAAAMESDHSKEISFTVVAPLMDFTVLTSTNLAAPRDTWTPVTTMRVAWNPASGPRFYLLRATPVATVAAAPRLAMTAGSKRGKLP